MADKEQSANLYVRLKRQTFRHLVEVVRETPPKEIPKAAKVLASAAGSGASTVQRVMEAISKAQQDGYSIEQIIELGQSKVMSNYVKERKKRQYEPLVRMSFMVSPQTKAMIEAELVRIGGILKHRRFEQTLEWLGAQMSQWSRLEVQHADGGEQCEVDANQR